jgi:hypothetical protein
MLKAFAKYKIAKAFFVGINQIMMDILLKSLILVDVFLSIKKQIAKDISRYFVHKTLQTLSFKA